jgi:hypothetical protein
MVKLIYSSSYLFSQPREGSCKQKFMHTLSKTTLAVYESQDSLHPLHGYTINLKRSTIFHLQCFDYPLKETDKN